MFRDRIRRFWVIKPLFIELINNIWRITPGKQGVICHFWQLSMVSGVLMRHFWQLSPYLGELYAFTMASSKPPLLDQVREVARLRHFSLSIEKSYTHYIQDYILLHPKRPPKDMGESEIRAYLSHLAINRNVTASPQTVALSALLFLYRQVLDRAVVRRQYRTG